MTTAAAPVRLIPRSELAALLAGVMARREYMAMESCLTRTADGWTRRPLPPDKGLRLADFAAAIAPLPDPAPEPEAAAAIVSVLRHRGNWFLASELDDEWEKRWPAPAPGSPGEPAEPGEPAPGQLPLQHCRNCGKLYQPRRMRSAYCSGSCRQMAYVKRQKAAYRG